MDTGYWWPPSAGYADAIATMRYAPVESWLRLAEELQRTGMTAAEAALVMGGNMARVASDVWGARTRPIADRPHSTADAHSRSASGR